MSDCVKNDASKPLAVITGATGGLGELFCTLLAQRGFDLVLIARNRDKLKAMSAELQDRFSVSVSCLPCDLSNEDDVKSLCHDLRSLPQTPLILVNNAGLGFVGETLSMSTEKAQEIIDVNIKALTALTLSVAPLMKEKGVGRILNVASIASFMPCPTMTVYAATKAYVLSFSEALTTELKGTGVSVTALCPGPLATAFWNRAGLNNTYSLRVWMTPADKAARAGLDALFSETAVTTPGAANRLLTLAAALAPRSCVRYLAHLWMKKYLARK